MTANRLAETFPDLTGRNVVVIGAGKSGKAAARLAFERGAHVTLADRGNIRGTGALAGIGLHSGGHPVALLDRAGLVILSPGVPTDIELVVEARLREIPVWGEVEFAFRFTRGRIVGITGSNGKSTVTALTGAMLRASGVPGGTGGNLDEPLSELLVQDDPDAVHALELSSFQLETIETFRPQIATLLNLSADHLDRHGTVEAYAAAKARIFENQTADDFAILNADDAPSRVFDAAAKANVHMVSTVVEIQRGAWVRDGSIVLRTHLGEEPLVRADELSLPGKHNLSNALAAALGARLAGASVDGISTTLRTFRPLEHRLECVGEINGVRFYNDSKATNPAATLPALDAFDAGTIHLIVGGKDKGGDWDTLVTAARERVRRVLVIGAQTAVMTRRFEGACDVLDCGTLEAAVEAGSRDAARGDVVLLSPACASFDQFDDFEHRGRAFRDAVRALGERHA
jgi:UDP-N-acetylmuramoylalanine--D-glutamate ligase